MLISVPAGGRLGLFSSGRGFSSSLFLAPGFKWRQLRDPWRVYAAYPQILEYIRATLVEQPGQLLSGLRLHDLGRELDGPLRGVALRVVRDVFRTPIRHDPTVERMGLPLPQLGDLLKKARVNGRLSQDNVAYLLGVSQPHTQACETGRSLLAPGLLAKFCTTLDIDSGSVVALVHAAARTGKRGPSAAFYLACALAWAMSDWSPKTSEDGRLLLLRV